MRDADPSTAERSKPRWWGCLLSTIVAALLLLALGAIGAYWYVASNSDDEPPPDLSDLTPHREEIAAELNGFQSLAALSQQEEQRASEPERETTEEEDAKEWHDRQVEMGEIWDVDAALEVLERKKALLDVFDRSVTAPEFQVPRAEGLSQSLAYLEVARSLVELACLRASALSHQGKHADAIDAALAVVRFGHRLEGADGILVEYMKGVDFEFQGLRVLREATGKATLEPQAFAALLGKLSAYDPDEQVFAEMAKRELRLDVDCIEAASAGEQSLNAVVGFPIARSSWTSRFLVSKFQLKPNRTTRKFADGVRRQIADFGTIHSRRQPAIGGSSTQPSLATPSSVGDWLAEMPWKSWRRALIRSSLERVSLAATRITIAIRCFQLENGRLPDSLKDLVPKYLPAVPVDPFDGSEMRYSAERKLIWSVGEDLIDAQGKDGGPDNTAEPTFALE